MKLYLCIVFIVDYCPCQLIYPMENKIKYLKKSKKSSYNEDFKELAMFGSSIMANTDISLKAEKENFVRELYINLQRLNCVKDLPQFLLVLYTFNKEKSGLDGMSMSMSYNCQVVKNSFYDLDKDRYFDAIKCYKDTLEISSQEQFTYVDRLNKLFKKYCRDTIMFIPLLSIKKKEVFGVLSFQTVKSNAFTENKEHNIYKNVFRLVSEFINIAIEKSYQLQEEEQNKVIEDIIDVINKTQNGLFSSDKENENKPNLLDLVQKIRSYFECEYCEIGKVVYNKQELDFYVLVESYDPTGYENEKIDVTSIKKEDGDFIKEAFKEPENKSRQIVNFTTAMIDERREINKNINFFEKNIVRSGKINHVRVLKNADNNSGYILLINIKKNQEHNRVEQKLIDFLSTFDTVERLASERDTKLISDIRIGQQYNIDKILFTVMDYLSKAFKAPIISFRIPLFDVGNSDKTIYYLRKIYVAEDIPCHDEIINHYIIKRKLFDSSDMRYHDDLRCYYVAMTYEKRDLEAHYYYDTYGLEEILSNKYYLLPVYSNVMNKCCFNNNLGYCTTEKRSECKRFNNIFGIFGLRLRKEQLPEEKIKVSLQELSIQLSALFKSIREQNDIKHSDTFKEGLKEINLKKQTKELDKFIAELLKRATDTKVCSIYRYWQLVHNTAQVESFFLSASTGTKVYDLENNLSKPITTNLDHKIKEWGVNQDNIYAKVYVAKKAIYFYSLKQLFDDTSLKPNYIELFDNYDNPSEEFLSESCMFFPIIDQNDTCVGIISFIGKIANTQFISESFWHHDIRFIDFFINIISKLYDIKEADQAKTRIFDQIMHELINPLKNILPGNRGVIDKYEKEMNGRKDISKLFYDKLVDNYNYSVLFKCIIDDVNISPDKSFTLATDRIYDAEEFVKQIVRLVEPNEEGDSNEAKRKDIKIMTHISELSKSVLDLDKYRITQVIINILNNTIQYSNPHSIVEIYYSKEEYAGKSYHEIRFNNYGIGIKEFEKEEIFKYQYRSMNAKAFRPTGTGVGLYVARKIIEAHGGLCFVKRCSSPTVIAICLPYKEVN